MPIKLTIIRPDDWHLHLRDGDALGSVVPHTAKRFARAIIMPNLKPPITTVAMAQDYRARILAARPEGAAFEPLMTLYLTGDTTADELARAATSGIVHGVKFYPAGATTHSEAGVRNIEHVYPALEAMQNHGLVLQVHGEVVDPDIDVFDRERIFIERVLAPLHARYPDLKIVLEHITTAEAVRFVVSAGATVAATITPQHILYNRNALFAGGLRPHHYCVPLLKRETHRRAIVAAAAGGNPKFFLGTDSAPHAKGAKESPCGCAGIYSAHAAIELYAEAFESVDALPKLENFASRFGATFYGLPVNTNTITLEQRAWHVPAAYPFGGETLVPLRAGESVQWRLAET
ncbi:MAG: dihydroorotase [Gammaproteobacteria bacterium]|nr:dihydroorotase [Gammaproteobacteria bacterium]MBA3730870.1 dihydroorotase [Gammaproteobacteria bacterium]